MKIKKYIGHFFYYWILPLLVGEKPFWGKTSFVFWDEASGLRDADYSAVFSRRDYDLCRKDGVASEKLFVIGHPLEHPATKRFFEKTYFAQNRKTNYSFRESKKILTIMWAGEKIGFGDSNHSFIPEKEMRESRAKVVKLIAEKLADWKIFIKPHPAVKDVFEVQEFFGQIPSNVFIVKPSEPADTYIEKSSVIVGMPPSSTTLFTASKQNPQKIVLSVNLKNEFLGDTYKDFEDIEYIDTEEQFVHILDSIGDGTYLKSKTVFPNHDFTDAAELINHLYKV